MIALISSVTLQAKSIEFIDHCHPNVLMYKLITSTDDEHESGFVRNQGHRDSQLKGDYIAA